MKKNSNLIRLYLMVITLPKGKKEVIADLLERFDVTANLSTLARGSANKELDKEIMFCLIKEDMVKDAILQIYLFTLSPYKSIRNTISSLLISPVGLKPSFVYTCSAILLSGA